jgi:hypothetical protein
VRWIRALRCFIAYRDEVVGGMLLRFFDALYKHII